MIIETAALLRGKRQVLEPARIELPGGGIVAVAGLNGAGKSTYLMAIAGLLPAQVRFEPEAPAIALMPQTPVFPGWATVRLVSRLYSAYGSGITAHSPAQIDESQTTGQLSPGQRQALALELACRTPANLYILDEPFSALDMRSRRAGIETIRRLHADRPDAVILVASQRAEDFVELCERFVVIADGTVRRVAPAQFTLGDPTRFEAELLELMTGERRGNIAP